MIAHVKGIHVLGEHVSGRIAYALHVSEGVQRMMVRCSVRWCHVRLVWDCDTHILSEQV